MWAASTPFVIGPYVVGVRSSSIELDAQLQQLLARHVVALEGVPYHYSVWLHSSEQAGGSHPRLHMLYRGGRPVVRSRSSDRVIAALVEHLDSHLTDARPDLLLIDAVMLVRDVEALVLLGAHHADVARLDRPLQRAGWRVVDRPGVALDEAGMVVLPQRQLEVDRAVLDELASPANGVVPGQYRVRGWLHVGVAKPASRAEIVVRAFSLAKNPLSFDGAPGLHALARAAEGAELGAISKVETGLLPAVASL